MYYACGHLVKWRVTSPFGSQKAIPPPFTITNLEENEYMTSLSVKSTSSSTLNSEAPFSLSLLLALWFTVSEEGQIALWADFHTSVSTLLLPLPLTNDFFNFMHTSFLPCVGNNKSVAWDQLCCLLAVRFQPLQHS